MRVRKFTNRGSTTKVIGKFPSLKNGKPVWWESQLERDFLYLLEIDDDVVSYYEQPLRIPYRLNGKKICVFPQARGAWKFRTPTMVLWHSHYNAPPTSVCKPAGTSGSRVASTA